MNPLNKKLTKATTMGSKALKYGGRALGPLTTVGFVANDIRNKDYVGAAMSAAWAIPPAGATLEVSKMMWDNKPTGREVRDTYKKAQASYKESWNNRPFK